MMLNYERRRMTDLLQLQGIEIDPVLGDEEAVDTVAQYVEMTPEDRQVLLETNGVLARARALVARLDRR
jgi:uncharacterized Fe-S cluster-containing radical SAM superfamily protein